jgi:hypothetical protein
MTDNANLLAPKQADDMTSTPEPDTDDAAHVLFHVGRGGWPGSTFRRALLAAVDAADARNLALIAAGFPGLVEAVRLVRSGPEGVAKLRKITGDDE